MTAEQWKPVPGWKSTYEVSNLGRVRSIRRPGNGNGRPHLGRVLRQRADTVGYRVVNLYRGEGPVTVRVHRIVAAAFCPNPRGVGVVMHLDNDKTNNRADNLRWGTHQDNSRQAYVDGINSPPSPVRGCDSPNARLNDATVRVMRRCRERGLLLRELSDIFGLPLTTIAHACAGKSWAHVEHGGPLA